MDKRWRLFNGNINHNNKQYATRIDICICFTKRKQYNKNYVPLDLSMQSLILE